MKCALVLLALLLPLRAWGTDLPIPRKHEKKLQIKKPVVDKRPLLERIPLVP